MEDRICWVCLGGEADADDDDLGDFVAPCKCRGSTQWVHQRCAQKWIDEKQKGCSILTVRCPQCQSRYIISMPKSSLVWAMYEVCDLCIEAACPVLAVGMVTSCIYASALSYGAMSVCQFIGVRQGVDFLRGLRPLNFCVGVPMIPVLLVLPRLVKPSVTVHRFVEPVPENDRADDPDHLHYNVVEQDVLTLDLTVNVDGSSEGGHQMSVSRAIVGGLFLPSIAATVGRMCFSNMFMDTWKRSVAGGLLYLVGKNMVRWMSEQQRLRQLKYRRVLNRPAGR